LFHNRMSGRGYLGIPGVKTRSGRETRRNMRPSLNVHAPPKSRPFKPGFAHTPYGIYNVEPSRLGPRDIFFPNAKPASLLERGLVLNTRIFTTADAGIRGTLILDDGPTIKVTLESVTGVGSNSVYTFRNEETGETFTEPQMSSGSMRGWHWNFYDNVAPVPFVPRGGRKNTRKSRKARRTRKYSRRA